MPFICDDFEWKLVDDREPYDKHRFVVVRKLSVKPNERTPIRNFTVDEIRQRIEKFGEIELIEIMPNNALEAHVTFVSDRSAYLMLLQHEFDKKALKTQPFDIEIADSWEQPLEVINQSPRHDMEVDEHVPEIFKLNEDCLLHVFQFLDLDSLVSLADVCKMFNRLSHHHCFPHIHKYKVDTDDDPAFTLAKLRQTLLCIGPHITDLSYDVSYDEDDGPGHTSKFLKVIAQNVGPNLQRAYFAFNLDRDNRMVTLAPVLQNLESLEIEDRDEGSSYDINFQALCPKLIEFTVNMDMAMIACCKPWPSLRSLSVKNNMVLTTTTLISFIKQNPQLTCLEFAIDRSNKTLLILAVTKYLSRFEKLTIVNTVNESFFARNFASLSNLPLLREINLEKLDRSSLKCIVNHLPTFINLQKISLSCSWYKGVGIEEYGQSFLDLAEKLPFLEELKLQRIPIHGDILVEFISSASKLNVLYVQDCELVFSNDLISKLVDTLKVSRQESKKALQFYLNKKDLNELKTVKRREIEEYLQLKRA
ncbi:uncharacterized protein LOC129573808 [Sitodiplosis mosellana]|uniref:uncharacterized protein LOC129573808 n=1 Tax=Sitodiplosis mosellana TaxID=263140 RepID=UPI002443D74D|nr:uncharacterized protein LOC129573808 [Sitodiplosis mosellana]